MAELGQHAIWSTQRAPNRRQAKYSPKSKHEEQRLDTQEKNEMAININIACQDLRATAVQPRSKTCVVERHRTTNRSKNGRNIDFNEQNLPPPKDTMTVQRNKLANAPNLDKIWYCHPCEPRTKPSGRGAAPRERHRPRGELGFHPKARGKGQSGRGPRRGLRGGIRRHRCHHHCGLHTSSS